MLSKFIAPNTLFTYNFVVNVLSVEEELTITVLFTIPPLIVELPISILPKPLVIEPASNAPVSTKLLILVILPSI